MNSLFVPPRSYIDSSSNIGQKIHFSVRLKTGEPVSFAIAASFIKPSIEYASQELLENPALIDEIFEFLMEEIGE